MVSTVTPARWASSSILQVGAKTGLRVKYPRLDSVDTESRYLQCSHARVSTLPARTLQLGLTQQLLRATYTSTRGRDMQPALTTMVSSLNDDRRDAISWLVSQLRWERTLDRLRL